MLERAAAIVSERADAYRAEAASLENLLRLARATGMPDGEKPIP